MSAAAVWEARHVAMDGAAQRIIGHERVIDADAPTPTAARASAAKSDVAIETCGKRTVLTAMEAIVLRAALEVTSHPKIAGLVARAAQKPGMRPPGSKFIVRLLNSLRDLLAEAP